MSTLTLKKHVDEAESLRNLMLICADELYDAMNLRVGVMDSESKAQAIAAKRVDAMQSVITRLREAALA